MPIQLLINYHKLAQGEDPTAIYTAHTCPLDGYVYAWGDTTDNTLVWFLSACPVDAVRNKLTNRMSSIVSNAYGDQQDPDPHMRIQAIINKAKETAKGWLTQNATPAVANFLSDDSILFKIIFAELVTQGIIA
jgi:hypothetical protein